MPLFVAIIIGCKINPLNNLKLKFYFYNLMTLTALTISRHLNGTSLSPLWVLFATPDSGDPKRRFRGQVLGARGSKEVIPRKQRGGFEDPKRRFRGSKEDKPKNFRGEITKHPTGFRKPSHLFEDTIPNIKKR
jgi:hypothetical protein